MSTPSTRVPKGAEVKLVAGKEVVALTLTAAVRWAFCKCYL